MISLEEDEDDEEEKENRKNDAMSSLEEKIDLQDDLKDDKDKEVKNKENFFTLRMRKSTGTVNPIFSGIRVLVVIIGGLVAYMQNFGEKDDILNMTRFT